MNDTVYALAALPNGELAVGGRFSAANGSVSPYLARYVSTCPASATVTTAGCPSSGGANTLTATNLPWTGATFRVDGTGLPSFAFIGVVTGFSTTSLPLSSVLPQGQPGCNLNVSHDVVDFVVSNTGTATAMTSLPNTPALAGAVFHQQMIPFEVDSALSFTAITATNSLSMTVGSF